MPTAPEAINCFMRDASLVGINRCPLDLPPKRIPIPVVYLITTLFEKLRDRTTRSPFAMLILDFMNSYADQAISPIDTLLNFVVHPRSVGRLGTYQHRCNARPLECRLNEALQLATPLLLSFFPDRSVSPASSRGGVHFARVAYVGCSPHIKFVVEAEEHATARHTHRFTTILNQRVAATRQRNGGR